MSTKCIYVHKLYARERDQYALPLWAIVEKMHACALYT